jgi:hypothetical protein
MKRDYQTVYTECLNEAFKSIEALHYKYNGNKMMQILRVKAGLL